MANKIKEAGLTLFQDHTKNSAQRKTSSTALNIAQETIIIEEVGATLNGEGDHCTLANSCPHM